MSIEAFKRYGNGYITYFDKHSNVLKESTLTWLVYFENKVKQIEVKLYNSDFSIRATEEAKLVEQKKLDTAKYCVETASKLLARYNN